jgi:deoxyribose-phosphate aldolase
MDYLSDKEGLNMDIKTVFGMIDHTLLKASATREDVKKACDDMLKYSFATLCIHPCNISFCADYLAGRGKITTVVGFPFGTNTTQSKAFEAADAIKLGADELDMVINIGGLKDRRIQECTDDIRAVVEAGNGATVKVIIETCLLTDDDKRVACDIIRNAGAHFVKTSTGFAGGGATVEDIKLLRSCVGADFGVKAAGGVRSYEDCVDMINAGATRIGSGSAVAIAQGVEYTGNY